MKFAQLKVGDQFILDGETYIKSTPLIANNVATGQQKAVARYVNVQLLTANVTQATIPGISTAKQALEYFKTTLERAIDSSTLSDPAKELVNEEIEKAFEETSAKI